MRLFKKVSLLCALAVITQPVLASDDASAASVLSCHYECKMIGGNAFAREISTLLIASGHHADNQTPLHRAHLVFLDGNQSTIFRSYVDLGGNDLDEVSVCHSITKYLRNGNTSGSAAGPPASGEVKVVIEAANQSGNFVNAASPNMNAFIPGDGITAWVKSVIGFFQARFVWEPDPFGDASSPNATGRTLCNEDQPMTTDATDSLTDYMSAPYVTPASRLEVVAGTNE